MKKQQKWKIFESQAHRVIQNLNPNASVYRNVYIEGKLSKVKRQVDVQLVEPEQYEFLAFECKDYKIPIDVPIVEGFNTKLLDIGAKKGALVANSSYSQAAQNMASSLGIDLLNLVDTKNPDIRARLYAGMILSDTSVEWMRVRIAGTSPSQAIVPIDLRQLRFIDENGAVGTAYEIFASLWNEDQSSLSHVSGVYEYRPPNENNKKIIGINNAIMQLSEVAFIYSVVEKHYVGKIEIIEAQGLYNVKDTSFQTRSITTQKIIPYDIEKQWKQIIAEELVEAQKKCTFGLSCSSILPTTAK